MRFIIIFTWLILISVPVFSQKTESGWKVENGWQGLIPIQSTKANVEKLFGKGIQMKSQVFYQFQHDTKDAIISVGYAIPCGENPHLLSRFDVPPNTLIRYRVELKQPIPITDLKFNKNRFERNVSTYRNEATPGRFSYKQFREELDKLPNESSGALEIAFWGEIIGNIDYVRFFEYDPTFDDFDKYRCEKTAPQ